MAAPLTLGVLASGDATDRLLTALEGALEGEASVEPSELPAGTGATVTVEFEDDRRLEDAEERVRRVLDDADPDWLERLEITDSGA